MNKIVFGLSLGSAIATGILWYLGAEYIVICVITYLISTMFIEGR